MHKLFYLKQKYADLPMQQSNAWLEGRKHAFGGSEIYNYIDNHDKEKYESLVKKKMDNSFIGNDYTNWGKLFEPVAKKIITSLDKFEIQEFGSVPHSKYPICYSPDGLIIHNNDLHLLEIKCPILRDVGQKMPKSYFYQIKTGMAIFPVVDCYFYEFKFRRCPLWSLNKSIDYDRIYHKENKIRSPPTDPLCCGYLIWKDVDCPIIDLSKFPNILEILKKNNCENKAPEIQIGGYFNGKTGLVLKWKLFKYKNTIFPNDNASNWLDEKAVNIWDLYKILYEFNNKG